MRYRFVVLVLIAGLLTSCLPQSQLGATPEPVVRLPGHMLPALAQATKLTPDVAAPSAPDQLMTITITLNRADQIGFEQYLADVQTPGSPRFQRFVTLNELTRRFGPTQQAYDAVLGWLTSQGFALVEGSANRQTLTVTGSAVLVERVFDLRFATYEVDGKRFRANDRDPALPAKLAPYVQAVTGLTDLAQPRPDVNAVATAIRYALIPLCLLLVRLPLIPNPSGPQSPPLDPNDCYKPDFGGFGSIGGGANGPPGFSGGSGLSARSHAEAAPTPWRDVTGAGQIIGLLEFDTFDPNDVRDFLAYADLPAARLDNVSQKHVNGGAPAGSDQAEVLVDIISALLYAPGAKVRVYDGPFTGRGTSFQTLFNAMVNDGVTVMSNSWAYCEDQTTLADVQSIDAILATAAGAGITVVNASGDGGSTCLDGSPSVVGVPASSPSATAVGGTSLVRAPELLYGSETWWNGTAAVPPTGQGGFGVSRFFDRPAYQNGHTDAAKRSVPDVATNADPREGLQICQASNGGCPNGRLYGGTSMSAPIWGSFAALLNQARGQNLGSLNPLLYPLANTNAFHSPASLGSDFAHVGLGSPNLNLISLALTGASAGSVDATASTVRSVLPGTLADGTTPLDIVVQLRDANGNTVSGKTVSLAASAGTHSTIAPATAVTNVSNGAAFFTVKSSTVENVTYTATDTTDGITVTQTLIVQFIGPPAAGAGITSSSLTVIADGNDQGTVTVTLRDAQDHGAAGKLVNLSQGNGNSIVTAPSPPTTDSNGVVTFIVKNKTAETVTYTATDVTDGDLPVPGSASIVFNGGTGSGCTPALGVPTVTGGFAVTSFATGFVTLPAPTACSGPIGLAFDPDGDLFVMNQADKHLYKFGPAGGIANAVTRVTPSPSPYAGFNCPDGLAFSKDGQHLYLAIQSCGLPFGQGSIVEVSPTDGHVLRTVAGSGTLGGNCPTWLATDPLSGDLFASEPCSKGGSNDIIRIANPQAAAPTQTVYASPGLSVDLHFGPDGTLYTTSAICHSPPNCATFDPPVNVKIAGTNTANPGRVTILENDAAPGGSASLLPALNRADPSQPPYLVVTRQSGMISKVDLTVSPPADSTIATGGSQGLGGKVGPDLCGYLAQSDRILRLTNADGSCGLAPSVIAPHLILTPSAGSPTPVQGTTRTFTARVTDVGDATGVPITFSVNGANAQTALVRAAADGTASFTYVGVNTGADTVTASTTVANIPATSNPASLTWTPGKHATFLSLNLSPTAGAPGSAVALVASLTDVAITPAGPANGAEVKLSLGGQTCTASTSPTGLATCTVTASQAAGRYLLTATFAGDAKYVGDQATIDFVVNGDAAPPAGSCIPRPNDTVQVVEDRPGHMSVTLTAGNIPGSFVNLIRTVRFGAPVNASVDVGTQTGQRTLFNVSPPGGVPTLTFGVNRLQAGQPFMVPLVIADNYSDFPTLVGDGHADAAPTGLELLLRTVLGAADPSDSAAVTTTALTALANPGNDCVKRPDVQVQVTPDRPGRLKVTLTAASIPPAPGNLIWSIRFGAGSNATIDTDTRTADPGPFVFTSANGTPSFTFFVNRVQAGQPSTVQLIVTDYYGEFPTIVGGGPSAF